MKNGAGGKGMMIFRYEAEGAGFPKFFDSWGNTSQRSIGLIV